MYIVGIDIGKNHHEASIVSPEGKQIGPSLRFATTHKGADSLMSFIFDAHYFRRVVGTQHRGNRVDEGR